MHADISRPGTLHFFQCVLCVFLCVFASLRGIESLHIPETPGMTFDRPWILLSLLLPIAWAVWEYRATARRLALGLKTATFVCVVLALSGPRITIYTSKVAVAVLADTSAS